MRPNLAYGIKNLAAVQEATAPRADAQRKWCGLVKSVGKKDYAVPRIRIQRINLDSVENWGGLPAGVDGRSAHKKEK